MKILVINGPNINMLGIREPDIYGKKTYDDLILLVTESCAELGMSCECFQSNSEGAIVDAIQKAYFDKVDGIIFNPAAYTHTSVAILDALKAVSIPTVEVHISDVGARDDFRQRSYISPVCEKTISGHGLEGYREAAQYLAKRLEPNR